MTISRRVFLKRASVLLAIPSAIVASQSVFTGCSDDGECGDSDHIEESTTALVVTSRCAEGHNHTFTLTAAELAAPPPTGVSRPSEPYEGDGHTHLVVLSELQMMRIEAGETILVTSAISDGHAHVFALRRITGV